MLAKGPGDLALLKTCPGDFELPAVGTGDLKLVAKGPGDLEKLGKCAGDLEMLDTSRGFIDGDCLNKGTGVSKAMVKEFDNLELMPNVHFDVLSSGMAVADWIGEHVALVKEIGSLEVKLTGPEDSE